LISFLRIAAKTLNFWRAGIGVGGPYEDEEAAIEAAKEGNGW